VVLECFPFVGLVAPLCGKNIVKALKLPLIGVLESEHFPVFGVVQNEQPSHPARIYGNQKLVVFISEMNLKIPPETVRSITDCIIDFAHRHRSPMIYSIEGIPKPDTLDIDGKEVTIDIRATQSGGGEDEEYGGDEEENASDLIIDDTLLTRLTLREQAMKDKLSSSTSLSDSRAATPKKNRTKKSKHNEEEDKTIEDMAEEMFGKKMHYITTNIEAAKKLRAAGLIPVVDGIIPGTSGGLISKAPLLDSDLDVTVLLAPTSLLLPDPNSVLPILKILSEMVPGVELDSVYAEIEKEGTDLHKMISSLLEKTVAEKKGKVPFGMYG